MIAIINLMLKSTFLQSIFFLLSLQPNYTKTSNFSKEKDKDAWAGVLSCLMYTFCSVFMVLSNKAISSTLPDEVKKRLPQLTVILFQCLVAVLLVEGAKLFKIVEYPNFNWKVARAWLPLNLLFIGMLITGFLSLVYVSVPMVTVFKNLTNLVTVTGDFLIFREE
jgi:GDP-mannose transporter